MRVRRLRKEVAHLEVTAFINLIVVLVPFLLSTAVFTRLAVMDLSLPAQSTGAAEQLKVNELKLEVVIRPDRIDVSDRIGGMIQSIPNAATGPDYATLGTLAQALKQKFPQQKDATVLAEPNTPYDTLVQTMDAVRESQRREGVTTVRTELFPAISIGDAPIVTAAPRAGLSPARPPRGSSEVAKPHSLES